MVTLDLNPYTLNREVMPGLPRKGKHVGGGGAARGVALLELAQPLAACPRARSLLCAKGSSCCCGSCVL